MRASVFLFLTLLMFSCQKSVSTSAVSAVATEEDESPGSILGKWNYVESATEARNMGIPVILPWPINGLTFNEDGTLLVDTRKDGILPGTWFLDQENGRYILNSKALFLNETFIKVTDVLSKKMVLSYSNSLKSIELPDGQSIENSKLPTYLYKRSNKD